MPPVGMGDPRAGSWRDDGPRCERCGASGSTIDGLCGACLIGESSPLPDEEARALTRFVAVGVGGLSDAERVLVRRAVMRLEVKA